MRYPDTRTEEYIQFMGGPKDDGWEIVPKGTREIFIPVMSSMRLWDTEIDLTTTTRMITATYRYNGRKRMAENLFGALVSFRIFDWEGER
jgi:hypothetical protein